MRLNRRVAWLLLIAALALAVSGCFGKRLGQVTGTVLGPDEQPVAGARVTIDKSTTLTDASGNFVLKDIPYGPRQLNVYVDGVIGFSEEIRVNSDQVVATATLHENMLENPAFLGAEDTIPPTGWILYSSFTEGHEMYVVDNDDPETRALVIDDKSSTTAHAGEIGLSQTPVGEAGRLYKATIRAGAVSGSTDKIIYLQLRFVDEKGTRITQHQINVDPLDTKGFEDFSVEGVAPEGTAGVRIYVYTPQSAQPTVRVHSVSLWDPGPA